ncbi:MAG: TIGR04423 family type III CRISPR-associated protein [Epsilonproteobacteria bacterium]|nr:TIGR04423 family type III CRISPR-associated protein [Campylobacterota bacterium]
MKKNRTEILEYINNLQGYEGYIQMSDRPISDIWTSKNDIVFNPSSGFIYEAHFCNGIESIAIRQINDAWHVATTQLSEVLDETNDIQEYDSIAGKVKMAQIWKEEADELCENMPTKKLKKVVFAGFVKGEEK